MGHRIDEIAASDAVYDAIVVGSGVSGAIIANQLGQAGFHVLVLESGEGGDMSLHEYDDLLTTFYSAPVKDNNSPYARNPNAPMPRSTELRKLVPGQSDSTGYLVQNGPFAVDSTYTRIVGGTTMHWEGKALRMLPEDFEIRTRYGVGVDWPIGYRDVEPYYRRAERELGVSADVEDQSYLGVEFANGYVYPMRRMPPSYLDELIARGIDGMQVSMQGEPCTLRVRSTPQARNGIPNPAYDAGAGFTPVGAVSLHQAEIGGRCQGNINCTPICPVQAKYSARKTLDAARRTGNVEVVSRTVASRVVPGEDGQISRIEYTAYGKAGEPRHTSGSVRARIFVLAGNPVENPRLMLASDLPSSSGLMGRNLMDHAYLLTWGLMPQVAGALRGTQCTSGIEDTRGGRFRERQAAYRIGIHNDGWGWATGSPYTDLLELVDDRNRVGTALRQALVDRLSRQLLLAFMVELPAERSNRVTVDARYRDQLGNMRPVLSYNLPDYTMAGIADARRLSRLIFARLGVEDHTSYDPQDPGYVTYQGEGYAIRGGNHWAGTHMMGTDAATSVVDTTQRSWDHDNLYLVGPGSMPSIGTANTTLTLAALCFRSAETMVADLQSRQSATVQSSSSNGGSQS